MKQEQEARDQREVEEQWLAQQVVLAREAKEAEQQDQMEMVNRRRREEEKEEEARQTAEQQRRVVAEQAEAMAQREKEVIEMEAAEAIESAAAAATPRASAGAAEGSMTPDSIAPVIARTGVLDAYSDDADGVRSWLTDNKLTDIAEILVNAGVDTMTVLLDVTEGDKDDLAEEGLKKMKFKTLMKAINAVNAVNAGGVGDGGGGDGDGGGGESKDDSNGAAGSTGEEAGECVVCMDEENTHTFVPCGHKCVCKRCADMIMESNAECPKCRGEAREAMRVFV